MGYRDKSLKRKLIASYILMAAISTVLISLLANVFLINQFKDYVSKNQKNKKEEIITSLSNSYGDKTKWNADIVENIGMDAMQYGLIVSVYDLNGKTIWDARKFNNGICEAMITHMSENMSRYSSVFKGSYMEKSSPVYYRSVKVGTIKIGYYGPFFFTDNDLIFLTTLNKIIIGVGLFSLLCALLLGIFMAGNLSTPIQKVTQSARSIAKGHFSDSIDTKSNIKEISELTSTINGLAENLNKQENLRKKLTSDVAHELRTPLTTLQTHIEAIQDGIWDPTPDRIGSCYEEVVRINRLVGDLEKVARYESENFKLEKIEFDFNEMAKNVFTNFESQFLSKGIHAEYSGEHTMMYGDKDKLTQVVINLLSNAIKYTNKDGSINVSVKSNNGIELIVADTGIGISEEDLPNIFERFFRADKSRSRHTGGAGIGLTIAKSIIDSHGGQIFVKSTIGKGTEFKVKLDIGF